MSKTTNKEIFTVLGTIGTTEVETERGKFTRHTFLPNSQGYMRDNLNKIPVGEKVSVTFSKNIPTRSEAQLAFHWVLMSLISDYVGCTPEEMHDFVMRVKFGTKKIKIGKVEVEVRKSISNSAKMPKHKAVELIDMDLKICKFLELKVPTKKELGYQDETEQIDNKKFHEGLELPSGDVKF